MNVTIRKEKETDREAIRQVVTAAFGQADEARLVDSLREIADPYLSLVAVEGDEIVGHVLFTPVTIASENGMWRALGLGPMAVTPPRQRSGIGGRLVREGLERCHALGQNVVVLVGHPEYYPRFGFVPASRFGVRYSREIPDEVFLLAELEPGAVAGRSGTVRYLPPFDDVE